MVFTDYFGVENAVSSSALRSSSTNTFRLFPSEGFAGSHYTPVSIVSGLMGDAFSTALGTWVYSRSSM